MVSKRIASIKVVRPGSAPDVDSDFATYCRDAVLEHCEQIYGKGNVSNIITFNTLAAKGAFKAMCTIYQVPFAQANKLVSLIPPPIEGVDCTIEEIFDPTSARYSEGADFRNATAGEEWQAIIEGAKQIEGRNKSTGVHPCGVIMSSKPLADVVPLQVRQDDGRVISQWKYTELESLGLLKFDFLGLDTVDLIQHTVEYIRKNGKVPPNMVEIIHGDMDDPKTYEMIGRGETIGVFQLSGDGVMDLLRRMKPTKLDDIVATTALYRPGPMNMQSHIKYADRKNGREKIEYPIHPEFKGSALEKILENTYSLVVYQEQIMQIANQIAGMTLQEGDDLRKAMGKKKMDVMVAMKPKFFEGAKKNGFSEEAIEVLWDTIAEFAKYGFNKSHSVAYAINAYQAAYLKANYPVEFMAALIAQNVDKSKDKILTFLKEAQRMKLKVGAVDINLSDVRVAPDFTKRSKFDILYGLSGVNAVSEAVAKIIVQERDKNGPYKSVQDVINRCSPLGVSNKKVYENLALAGAFDTFGVPRKGVVENLSAMLGESKVQQSKGASLFDMLGGDDTLSTIDFEAYGEYPHLEKLKKESDVIGLYLTGHPLEHVGNLGGMRSSSIQKLLASRETTSAKIIGSLTDVTVKRMKRGGKSIAITLDDGTGYITGFLNKNIVKGIDKKAAQEKVKDLYVSGAKEIPDELAELVTSEEFDARGNLEKGKVYSVELMFRPGFDDNPYAARISSINEVQLSDEGTLPVRVRLKKPSTVMEKKKQAAFLKSLATKYPGNSPLVYAQLPNGSVTQADTVYLDAIDAIKMGEPVKTKGSEKKVTKSALTGSVEVDDKKATGVVHYRDWPPPRVESRVFTPKRQGKFGSLEQVLNLEYKLTPFKVDKCKALEEELEKHLGIENFDFGSLNTDIFLD